MARKKPRATRKERRNQALGDPVDIIWKFAGSLIEQFPDPDEVVMAGLMRIATAAWNLPMLDTKNPAHDELRGGYEELFRKLPALDVFGELMDDRRTTWAHDPRLFQIEVLGVDGDHFILRADVLVPRT